MFAKIIRSSLFAAASLVKESRNYANNNPAMSKTALLILPNGAEEMEAVITADVLRRAKVNVTIAGLESCDEIKCSRDVLIKPDASFLNEKSKQFDAVILPGGLTCSKTLCASKEVGDILKSQESRGGMIAAICAAPTALAAHDVCLGMSLTSYPSFKSDLEEKFKYVEDKNVVHDGILITSRGPATAFDFALKIVEVLTNAETAKDVAKGLLYKL